MQTKLQISSLKLFFAFLKNEILRYVCDLPYNSTNKQTVELPNFCCNFRAKDLKISNLYYTGDMPKLVTSSGSISAAERLGNTAPKKRCSGGEPLATQCPIRSARELNPKPPAPTAMPLTSIPTDLFGKIAMWNIPAFIF